MRRLLCALFVLLLLLLAAACDSSSGGKKQKKEYVRPDFIITENGVCDFVIIRAESASAEEIALAVELRRMLREEYGVDVQLRDDFVKEGTKFAAQDAEICFGKTNRAESQHASEGLKLGDWRILQEGTRLAIAFGSAEAGQEALYWFIENCMFPEQKVVGVANGLDREVRKDYQLDTITIAGKDISEYTIVGDKSFTSALRDRIAAMTGIAVRTAETRSRKTVMIRLEQLDDLGPEERAIRVVDDGIVAGTSGMYYPIDAAAEMVFDLIENCGGTIAAKYEKKEKIVNEDLKFISDKDLAALRAETDKRIAEIRATTGTPEIRGTKYYVSPNGNDSNSGTSPEQAWKTLARVNAGPLKSGDAVLFERGGVYRGQITAKFEGVTYSAYGTGDKPKLYGSGEDCADASKWTQTDVPNIWKFYKKMSEDVGTLVFNDGEACAIKCCIRTDPDGTTTNNTTKKPFKTYADLAAEEDLHFYQDKNTGEIWLRSDQGNPGTRWKSIEMNPKHNVIALTADGVTVDNLCIKYGGAHGVGGGTRKDITVQNCEFGWIGGTIQTYNLNGNNPGVPTRYGNAVELYGGCENYKITNCYFYQIYDAAVTHQINGSGKLITMKNIEYSDNVMEYCNYSIEYFLSHLELDNKSMISNCVMKNNQMWYAGYGFCEQRPDKGQDAHIKSWMNVTANEKRNPAEDFHVENNLFAFAKGMFLQIWSDVDGSMPTMKGNTYIQNINGPLGYFGIRDMTISTYDANAKATILNKFTDSEATVWFTYEPHAGNGMK